jgi:hypothetical protein
MTVAQIIDRHTPRTIETRPKFQIEYRDTVYLVADPNENGGIYQLPVDDNLDLKKYPNCLAVLVRKTNHRDFPDCEFLFGTILQNGRFVINIRPRVRDQRNGTPTFDNTWATMASLMAKAEEWHQGEVAWQVDKYVDRGQSKTPRNPPPRGIGGVGKTERERQKGKAQRKT